MNITSIHIFIFIVSSVTGLERKDELSSTSNLRRKVHSYEPQTPCCGTSWEEARKCGGTSCPNGMDVECPNGQQCYFGLSCNIDSIVGTCGGGNRGNGFCPFSGECCSAFGWCGGTATPCTTNGNGANTDPGTCGGGNRGNGICPNPVECCTSFGWCGINTGIDCATNGNGDNTYQGTCGGGNRGNGRCPISSECCSRWGWCGKSWSYCDYESP